MAPHRLLKPKLKTRIGGLHGVRWGIIRHTPDILIDYLLEVALTCTCALTSIAYFTGFSAQNALIRLLPPPVATGYAIALGVGALTMAYGLARKHYGTWLAAGLQLVAVSGVVYCVSLSVSLGFRAALTAILLSAVFSLVSAWRSFLLYSTFVIEEHDLAELLKKRPARRFKGRSAR